MRPCVMMEEVGVEVRSWFGSGTMQAHELRKEEGTQRDVLEWMPLRVVCCVWCGCVIMQKTTCEAANSLGFYWRARPCYLASRFRIHSQAHPQTSHAKHGNVPVP
jgi:hypothetical protein